jgi:hypothetical protein
MLDYTWKQKEHTERFRDTEFQKRCFDSGSGHVEFVVDTVALA